MKRTKAVWCFLLLGACLDLNLLENPSFDLWCGDSLCGWQTDEGVVKRTGTWHARDYGVSFESTPTQISQLSKGDPVDCIRFRLIADLDPKAQVSLLLDFNDDGVIDVHESVAVVSWRAAEFIIRPPAEYRSVRYMLRKTGEGRAVLAEITAKEQDDCTGERVTLQDGAPCLSDETCSSGACINETCSACAATGCGEGAQCTRDSQCTDGACAGGVCRACAAAGACEKGNTCSDDSQCAQGACRADLVPSSITGAEFSQSCAECRTDADCARGSCTEGACSLCSTDSDCDAGNVCRFADLFDAQERGCFPQPAEPHERGALCERDGDCADGLSCAGAPGHLPRCGFACSENSDCPGSTEVCARRGSVAVFQNGRRVELKLAAFEDDTAARIRTCYQANSLNGTDPEPCEVHEQCLFLACCAGVCTSDWLSINSVRCGSDGDTNQP